MSRSAPAAGASFTDRVLAELAPHTPLLVCCRSALVEGMLWATRSSPPRPSGDVEVELLLTPRAVAARVALAALHGNGVAARVERRHTPRRHRYAVLVPRDGSHRAPLGPGPCCARAALRGALVAAGSVSSPDRPPQLEIVVASAAGAERLLAALGRLRITAARTERRGRGLVVVRSIEGVAGVLSSIGAQGARLRFEEGRVVRELRGGVNRRLNGETANLRRTVAAGLEQARAAAALQGDEAGWRHLPAAVRAAAVLRLRHPQETVERLAARAGTSRSAMAGRLRRLLELAALAGCADAGRDARLARASCGAAATPGVGLRQTAAQGQGPVGLPHRRRPAASPGLQEA